MKISHIWLNWFYQMFNNKILFPETDAMWIALENEISYVNNLMSYAENVIKDFGARAKKFFCRNYEVHYLNCLLFRVQIIFLGICMLMSSSKVLKVVFHFIWIQIKWRNKIWQKTIFRKFVACLLIYWSDISNIHKTNVTRKYLWIFHLWNSLLWIDDLLFLN